jgi:hypothetical protein
LQGGDGGGGAHGGVSAEQEWNEREVKWTVITLEVEVERRSGQQQQQMSQFPLFLIK